MSRPLLIYSEYFYPMYHGVPVSSDLLASALVRFSPATIVYTTTPLGDHPELVRGYQVIRRGAILGLVWDLVVDHPYVIIVKGSVSLKAFGLMLLFPTPFVVWHEMANPLNYSTGRPLRDVLFRWLARFAARLTDLHVGVTGPVLTAKRLDSGTRTRVIYYAIRECYFDEPRKRETDQFSYDFCFVGRINYGKGALLLTAALETLDAAGVAVKICFAGDGEDIAEVRRRLEKLQHIKAEFTGILSPQGLIEVYDASRYLVMPSHTHPEGMGLVAAEAMARGTPLIASDQPAIMEAFADAAEYFHSGDTVELTALLKRLLEMDEKYADKRTKARRRAQIFHPNCQARVLNEFNLAFLKMDGCVI